MAARTRIVAIWAPALVACSASAGAQSTYVWASSGDGEFGLATNWSPMEVPGALDTAELGGFGRYVVSINQSRVLHALDIANPDAEVSLGDANTLALDELFGEGALVVHRDATSDASVLEMPPGGTIAGKVRLNAGAGFSPLRARVRRVVGGDPVTLTESALITGRGVIEGGGFESMGRIEAVGTDGLVQLSRVVLVQSPLAVVRADAGGAIVLDRSTIAGGSVEAGGDAVLVGNDSTIGDTRIRGTWSLDDGSDVTLAGRVEGDGEIIIQHRMTPSSSIVYLADGATIGIPLRLNAAPGASLLNARLRRDGLGDPPVLAATGGVTGRGRIDDGVFTLAGLLGPGGAGGGFGLIQLTFAQLDMTPSARMVIDIGGPADDQFDRIVGFASGLALGGALEINLVGGYAPGPDDEFLIVRDAAIAGAFASVEVTPPGVAGLRVVYGADTVTIVACLPDLDGDGSLSIFDFLAFQNLFDAGNPRADLDGDGALTLFDFLTFQNLFDAGCD